MIPSLGGFAWEGVIPSLGGLTWELFIFTWELFRLHEAKLFVHEAKLLMLVLLDLVIFPSFLIVSKFSLFNCLSLTLLNLVFPTLSTKSWHSLSFCVETIKRYASSSEAYMGVTMYILNNVRFSCPTGESNVHISYGIILY